MSYLVNIVREFNTDELFSSDPWKRITTTKVVTLKNIISPELFMIGKFYPVRIVEELVPANPKTYFELEGF